MVFFFLFFCFFCFVICWLGGVFYFWWWGGGGGGGEGPMSEKLVSKAVDENGDGLNV